jgi:hypothetical protein
VYWACFDRDGSGDITHDELVTLFKMIGLFVSFSSLTFFCFLKRMNFSLAKGVKINFIARAKAGYKELHLKKKGISKSTFKEFIDEISKRLDSEDIAKVSLLFLSYL